jgi:hypothetical protein
VRCGRGLLVVRSTFEIRWRVGVCALTRVFIYKSRLAQSVDEGRHDQQESKCEVRAGITTNTSISTVGVQSPTPESILAYVIASTYIFFGLS